VAHNQKWIHSKNPFAWLSAWVQREPFRILHKWGQNRTWSVDADLCSHCARCERICPADNIHLVDGLPVFGDQCNYCLRCYNFCPEQAIIAYQRPFNHKRCGAMPYQGPVPAFRPELIASKKEKSAN
jgi:NAD-dependent dihydropyrimidine dehydrogenase PreA subunit